MGIKPHPARMNKGIVNFFIDFLTDENDLIFDPFGGSNTTGFCAELKKEDG
ncbi:DNA methyltransferase [Salmonella enterica]|nr:DNA methyltransferase [Salmonella enterica]